VPEVGSRVEHARAVAVDHRNALLAAVLEVRDVRLQRHRDLDEGNMWPTSFALKELTSPKKNRSSRS
jgi:hypothetical protein